MEKTLKANAGYLFWDIDVSKLDLQLHKKYIIERILEYGDFPELKWLLATYSKNELIDILKNSNEISVRTGNYFYIMWGLTEPKENFKCLHKPYTQKQNRF